ncbi:hypothetical protein [Cerasicoccus maritimus]|uniref:hypothetical protein n=1 Tax=Cerasicoccus maritimus TaxID=490089 RepID=UPI002852A4B3|nr:hypothetical protein [Cerasicoccus maritimus]
MNANFKRFAEFGVRQPSGAFVFSRHFIRKRRAKSGSGFSFFSVTQNPKAPEGWRTPNLPDEGEVAGFVEKAYSVLSQFPMRLFLNLLCGCFVVSY